MKYFCSLFLLLLLGCSEQSIYELTWLAPVGERYDVKASKKAVEYSFVSSDKLDIAFSKLKNVRISSDVGEFDVDKGKVGTPYLIRCIQNKNNEGLSIFITENNNLVTECVGFKKQGFVHKPVIVYLKTEPAKVLCYVGIASAKR